MEIFEMLAVLQQMQMVLTKENPRLTVKVDVEYSLSDGKQYIAVMAGLWNGEEFTKYRTTYFDGSRGTDADIESVRKFRAEVESWEGE